jgi:hypothetical protein
VSFPERDPADPAAIYISTIVFDRDGDSVPLRIIFVV